MGAAPTDQAFATSLVSVLAQPAAIVDINGVILSWNTDFLSCLDTTSEQALGAELWTILKEKDQDNVRALFRDAKPERTSILTNVTTPSGQFKLAVNVVTDATQRGLFLCQLTPDEGINSSRLRFLLEHLNQGVWNYNTQTDALEVTDAWRRMRGLGANDSLGGYDEDPFRWLDAIYTEDREMVKNLFIGQARGIKDSYNAQYRRWHTDGHLMWISCRASVMSYDQNGHPLQIVGMDTDITDIKKNEAALTELNNKMNLANDVAGIGVWEYDLTHDRIHWDAHMLKIYGLTDQDADLSDDLWERHLHPDDFAEMRIYSIECLKKKQGFNRDFRIVRPDGEVRNVRSLARFVDTQSGEKLYGVNIDITDDVRRTQELETARQQMEHDSRHDALTGLANRRLLDETTQEVLERLGADDQYAVLHIDLDHFKQVNDTFGHAAGDQVLVQVAENMTDLVGDRGLVCRIGGDEFVVLLEDFTTQNEVHQLCERILTKTGEVAFLRNKINKFGLSIGCALGRGGVKDASEVFINADIALYAAKSDGRSCFRVFSPELSATTRVDANAYQNLRAALNECHISCYFQPQFDVETLEMVGAEALVRWICPDLGVMRPDEFLPLAKETGLLPRIDEFVFDFVLDAQTRWADLGLDVPIIALNLSQERLLEPSLLSQVDAGMKPHHKISFELLETAFLDTCDDGLGDVLDHLRGAGIRLELDDFGSGRSSIVALQTVNPDRVKFDRMLIAPLESNPSQILILEALAKVAQLEGCSVVVEGIETQRQLDIVTTLNCEALQGYMLAEPMPEDAFTASLRARRPK